MDIREIKFNHCREFRIFGLQRSGLHAITNWIIASLVEEGEKELNYLNFVNCNPDIGGPRFEKGDGMPDLPDNLRTPMDKLKGTLILGFEEWDAAKWVRDLDTGVESTNVFVNRDLRDVFASRLARLCHPKSEFDIPGTILKTWGEWMTNKSKDGIYNMLKYYDEYWPLPDNTVVVKYDEWLYSDKYRVSKAEEVGIKHHGLGMDKVSKYGGGSSFDKLPEAGGSRWVKYAEHPMMVEFLKQLGGIYGC